MQGLIGLAVGFLLIWFLLRGISWEELKSSVTGVSVGWLLLAQIPIWLSFFTRILRWSYIVRAVHPASFRSMFSATQLAFLANFTIAMRIGEFVRALVLSRLAGISFSKSLALGALDRVTDLIGLMAVMLVTVAAFRPTDDIILPEGLFGFEKLPPIRAGLIQSTGAAVAVGLVGLLFVLVMLYVNQKLVIRVTRAVVGRVSSRIADWVCHLFEQFAQGLHVFRSVGDMAKSTAYSLVTWSFFMLALYFTLNAFHISYPWYGPFVIQSLLALAVSAPIAPGMLGQFHLPLVAGIIIVSPDTPITDATALAIVTHLTNLFPVIILGILSIMMEGVGILKFRSSTDTSNEEAR
ncbi:MAG: hypothetical protein AMXMBFR84_35850 [Candidatus Hydrogenedentota bacterium]